VAGVLPEDALRLLRRQPTPETPGGVLCGASLAVDAETELEPGRPDPGRQVRVGQQGEGTIEVGYRAFRVAALQQGDAAKTVRIAGLRVELDRLRVVGDGEVDLGQVEVGDAAVWREANGLRTRRLDAQARPGR